MKITKWITVGLSVYSIASANNTQFVVKATYTLHLHFALVVNPAHSDKQESDFA